MSNKLSGELRSESLSSEVFKNEHDKHLSGRGWLSAILRRAGDGLNDLSRSSPALY